VYRSTSTGSTTPRPADTSAGVASACSGVSLPRDELLDEAVVVGRAAQGAFVQHVGVGVDVPYES
jgi:hypothetical protein